MRDFLIRSKAIFVLLSFACVAPVAHAQRQMEQLGRGVVAVRTSSTQVYVGWRLLGTDPDDIGFNLYRVTSGVTNKLNGSLLTNSTDFVDGSPNLAQANAYFVVPVSGGVTQSPSAAFTLQASSPTQQYLNIPLQKPPDGITPDGVPYTYNANDCSAADLDGDGEYEIVLKWDPSNSKDNSQAGLTGNVFIDAYKLDGTRLWRIDLGRNIRAGAHYTQFMVYDLDGDGRAEIACKTAPGTVDGQGSNVIMPGDNPNADYRDITPNPVSGRIGYVLNGPEYFTIFDGLTGANLATTNYVPARGNISDWGDNYGNRVDRFLAGVAYLDGRRPSVVMCRGYYTRAVLAAWDWRNGQLTQHWVFDTGFSGGPWSGYKGQGAHSLTVGDVDGDGKDEIVYGAAAIDDNGTGLYTTQLGHGDAEHLSDMDPSRPGLEVWMVHEEPNSYGPTGLEFRDAGTGSLIFGLDGQNSDVGRGVAIDIDPRYPGYEMWGARGGLMSATGVQITTSKPAQNFAIWWDSDTLREILDGTTISKWNWNSSSASSILSPGGLMSNNSTKSTPCLSADLFGDWREEVVWRTSDDQNLRIYTTTNPATNRLYTLMHDPQYRVAIAWQNTAYNQPPHPGFYIGPNMHRPPVSPMSDANLVWGGGAANVWDTATTSQWFTNRVWMSNYTSAVFQPGNSVLFDLAGSNTAPLNLVGALSPSSVTVHAPKDYTFAGTGALTGDMSLIKAGTGTLTLNNTNDFTGTTLVTEGTLRVNGTIAASPVVVHGSVWGSKLAGNGRLGKGATLFHDTTLQPGNATGAPGTLTVSNQLIQLGSVLNQLDLSNDPTGMSRTNDRVDVIGNLSLSGTNIIHINQPDGFLGGGVYTLFSYTGSLTGGLANLKLEGDFIQPVALTNPPGAIALVAIIPDAPPTAPATLNATAVGAFQINLLWTDSATDENAYRIERSTNNVTFAQITTVDAGETSYSDIGLMPTTTYYYKVHGTNLAGFGNYSPTASATTTAAPLSLTWRGDGTSNLWDLTTSQNWYDGSGLVVYNDNVAITFDQSGSNNTSITLVDAVQPNSVTVNASKSYTLTGSGSLGGAMSLVKSGSGGLTMNVANTFSGGVTLNSGTFTLGNSAAAGSGPLRLNGGTLTLNASGSPAGYGNALQFSNNTLITISGSGNNNQSLSGSWTGTTTVTTTIGSGGTFSLQGSMTAFSGTVSLSNSAGTFRFYGSSGSSAAAFNLGTSSASMVNRDGSTTIRLGSLSGNSGTFLRGRSSGTGGSGSNYEIGGKNTNSTFSGQILDGGDVTRITKVGNGALTLAGNSTYTGPTAVNAGTLLVNGNNASAIGAVTVASTGTLGGTGTIGGSTTISGKLTPGTSIGRLTFNTNLLLSASSTAIFEISKSPFTNDVVRALGTVTYGGQLSVVNISPELFQAGDNFRLFDAVGYNGAFNNLSLPALDDGLDWSTNKLTVDGRLWVVSTVPPQLANARLTGEEFAFDGSGGTPGWDYYVLTSTNLMLPADNWTRIATNQFDGSGNFLFTDTISGGGPGQFYRLQLP